MQRLTAGQLAKKANVNVETIRYYERRQILPRPARTSGGYRIYPEHTISRIRFVKRAQDLGFSLKEIRELLGLRSAPGGNVCHDVRKRAELKISDIDQKIQDLTIMRKNLTQLMTKCSSAGPAIDCPILEGLEHDVIN